MSVLTGIGSKKVNMAKKNPIHYLFKAIMGGLYLGVAMILSYTLGALFIDSPEISKLLIAFSFGIGIILILFLGAELFTGNCLTTTIAMYQKKCTIKELIPSWFLCYLGNMIGIVFICVLFIWSQASNPLYDNFLRNINVAKLDYNVIEVFLKAVLCNFIVCIASYAGVKIKDDTAKTIIIFFVIAAFVLPGFEHCIANFGTFALGIAKYGTAIDWSGIPLHTLASTLGNMVGGAFLFATPMYFLLKSEEKEVATSE
ncbi:formate/nitrite transporter family protein [Breznakia pachnodae]|uniref:Nitrite transporter NirC n=1 Tax=Breznakia pachnodae TaxID=265178 RepID=A0ABU0DXY3_9FIRM|nr:formate/nitrite transporter family protein [Breznakia pachnodae]MDQ0359500.1 nitrite transporter NirC [Breznakia pachnodae]